MKDNNAKEAKILKINGAEIMIRCLKEQGVDTVFGYPGGAVLNIYDALYKSQDDIKHILTSHEQGAAHAADGYARATGKVGVCIATSGPGATNLVTGIATAYMDSVPIVAFTGQVATTLLGKDSFQEVDITGITMPITKHNYIVKDVNDLARVIREGFRIARGGRPGPVLIDICKDVTAAMAEYEPQEPIIEEVYDICATDNEIKEAVKIIEESEKPIILAGGGIILANACEELLALAEKSNIPVTTTLIGLGGFSSNHPLITRLVGMHGARVSNLAVSDCDLFIAIGARFSDRVISNVKKFAPNAKIMHIDIDPAEIGKKVSTDYPLIGNLKLMLQKILASLNEKKRDKWIKKLDEWNKESIACVVKTDSDKLTPRYVLNRLYDITNGDAIITTEVGQNQLWAAQHYRYIKPRTYISSGGLGTMGYGLGACIGAQIGKPDKKVINVAGDGSFRMNCNELATAVEYKLPIIVLILNNHVLGMVRQWQDLFYDSRFSSTTIDRGTDFVKLAEAYGAKGMHLEFKKDVDRVLKEALASDVPVVINCEIDRDEKVFPIVPPGAPIYEIIEE